MKYRYFLTAFALAALFSCTKEVQEGDGIAVVNPNPPQRRVEFISFKASLDDRYKTKTAVDLSITHKVIWEKDDEVLIEDENGKSAVYKAISGGRDTTTLVRVSGDTLAVAGPYKAWYPATYRDEGLPAMALYDGASTFRGAPMYAEGMSKLDFHPECGIVRFSYNPLTSVIVKSLKVESDREISKTGGVTMDITHNYPNGRTLYPTSRNEFAFNMLPGEYENLHVELYNGKDTIDSVTLLYTLNVIAGNIMDVDLNNPEGREVNLSRLGTANCYIITHSGDFFFTPTKGCTTEPVGEMASVDLVWETDNSTTAIANSSVTNLSYTSDKVCFTVPEDYTPSNALIAAKDAGGNILWSWHLWICDGPFGHNTYDDKGNMMLMDRSIGTLSPYDKNNNKKYLYAALLFQWGRKDPFPGCTVNGTSGVRPLSAVAGAQRIVENEQVSVETSIKNPFTFYADDLDWLSEPTDTLWAESHKTVFDPCPVGYRIAPMSAYSSQTGDFYQGWFNNNYANSTGIYAGKNTVNQETYSYPLTNRFVGSNGAVDEKGSTFHLDWTTDISGASQPLAVKLFWNNGKVDLATDQPFVKSDGLPVRCMLIQE